MSFSVAAVMLVKDEADVIEPTVRHLLTQVDHVIVADNDSTDGTLDILYGIVDEQTRGEMVDPHGLWVRQDPEVGYFQSRKTTALAQLALEAGHDWVVPCDADEWWYSSFGRLGDILEKHHQSGFDIVGAEMYDHVPTALDNASDPNPFTRMRWRRTRRGELPKVACRLTPGLVIEQGNHAAHYTDWPGPNVREFGVTIRHYPYRSDEQFVRKARNGAYAYAATDLPDDMGKHWRQYGQILDEHGPNALVENVFRRWFYSPDPPSLPPGAVEEGEEGILIEDPAP